MSQSQKILPWDVRYALQYRKAQLGVSEVLDLAINGFEPEAAYLAIKMAAYDRLLQLEIIRQFVESVRDLDEVATRPAIRRFVELVMARIPRDRTVAGGKLAQISRQGFETWQEKFRVCSEASSQETADVYLLGHAIFMGLAFFVQAFHRAGKKLRTLIPDMALKSESYICGYELLPEVTFLPAGFVRGTNAVIIDDMQHTGESAREMRMFWKRGGGSVSRFRFLAVASAVVATGN